MFKISPLIISSLLMGNLSHAFAPCGTKKSSPDGEQELYRIVSHEVGGPTLEPVLTPELVKDEDVFEVVNENAEFTTYRCWDEWGHTTGFDAQLITEIVSLSSNYFYIRFTSIPWDQPDDGSPITFFSHIDKAFRENSAKDKTGNVSGGSVAVGGMSITPERQEWGRMIGPIYRAGKVLIGRIEENKALDEQRRLELMQILPDSSSVSERYGALRGLTLVTEGAGSIRGKYFLEMAEKYPDQVKILQMESVRTEIIEGIEVPVAQKTSDSLDSNRLNVILTNNPLINSLTDNQLKNGPELFGQDVDLLMIDTGSIEPLTFQGKIETGVLEVVTHDLSLADDKFSHVFGQGDGIVVASGNVAMQEFVSERLRVLICSGRVDELVKAWFNDSNSADRSWAQCH